MEQKKKATKLLALWFILVGVAVVGTASFTAYAVWHANQEIDQTEETVVFTGITEGTRLTPAGTKLLSFDDTAAVSNSTRFLSYSFTVDGESGTQVTLKLASSAGHGEFTGTFYYKISSTEITSAPADTSGYVALNTEWTAVTPGTYYLTIILDSDAESDMGKDIRTKLTVM